MDGLCFGKDGTLKAALPRNLVSFFIDENEDQEALAKFLMTFPVVISAEEVWNVMSTKYEALAAASAVEKERILAFLQQWLEREAHRDFLHKSKRKLFGQLVDFLAKFQNEEMGIRLKLLILRSAKRRITRYFQSHKKGNARRISDEGFQIRSSLDDSLQKKRGHVRILSSGDFSSFTPMKASGSSGSVSGLLGLSQDNGPNPNRYKLTQLEPGKFEFHDLEPEAVAAQLTLIEHEMFRSIKHSEFLHMSRKKDGSDERNAAPNLVKMVDRFNLVSYWVATEIVMQNEAKQREKTIRKFVLVAEHLRELNNYNGVMEVIAGLNLWPITRMRATWEEIGASKNSAERLNELMDPKKNFLSYRTALKQSRGPIIPYLGIFTRDLLFIEEGNPDWVGDSKRVVNFEKLLLLGDVILQLKQFQDSSYNFVYDPILQDFLSKLQTLPEEMLVKHSLICEPSKHDH
eukprot:TRINITY_DN928_c0_g1_i2.p1 TRINITY_DN928_c0_g1~~TRINITY_DN928_c0_g1_i2.p1  ORF type:complete len:460 (+),score=96.19 TRINITY_DN928_c0_g1_i2:146-1525(+)